MKNLINDLREAGIKHFKNVNMNNKILTIEEYVDLLKREQIECGFNSLEEAMDMDEDYSPIF